MTNLLDKHGFVRDSFALYIPSTKKDNVPMTKDEHNQIVLDINHELLTIFGGSTRTKGVGSWQSETGRIIHENVTIITVFDDNLTSDKTNFVVSLALRMKSKLGQESVMLEVNDKKYFL